MNPIPQPPQQQMTPPPQQNQPVAGSSAGKSPSLPQQPFSPSHHHIYNMLRNNLMELVKAGVPGMEKVLAALNNAHVDGIKSQAQQPPQMPQQGFHPETGQFVPQPMPSFNAGSVGSNAVMQTPQMPR